MTPTAGRDQTQVDSHIAADVPAPPLAAGIDRLGALTRTALTENEAGASINAVTQSWRRAWATGDLKDALRQLSTLDNFTGPADRANPELTTLHLASVDALARLGWIDDAEAKVQWLNAVYGPRRRFAPIAARLQFLQGDYELAVHIVDGARALPVIAPQDPSDADLFLLKVSYLIEQGDLVQARALLLADTTSLKTSRAVKLLRLTITSRADVASFRNAVQPYLAQVGAGEHDAAYHLSVLLRQFEDFDGAIALARERFLGIVRRYGFGTVPKAKGRAWTTEAEVALADLQDDFRAAGLEFFLISGTLLGCVREKGILGHDKDIDVGVMEDVSLEAVTAAIRKSKRFYVRPIAGSSAVYVEHANGVKIDVFRHFMEGGRYLHEGIKVAWWNTPFDLTRTEFLGRGYLIPSDPDRYLTENYGDWHTPVPEFETFVDTTNIVIRNPAYLIWHYFVVLGDYFVAGRMAQFVRVWRALEKLHKPDAELSALVEKIISSPDMFVGINDPDTFPVGLAPLSSDARASVDASMRGLGRKLFGKGPASDEAAYLEARRLNELRKERPNDARLVRSFENAALAAGRTLQSAQKYKDACAAWYSLIDSEAQRERALRNLEACALKGARTAEARDDRKEALLFWRYLKAANPASETADKGIARNQ